MHKLQTVEFNLRLLDSTLVSKIQDLLLWQISSYKFPIHTCFLLTFFFHHGDFNFYNNSFHVSNVVHTKVELISKPIPTHHFQAFCSQHLNFEIQILLERGF